MKNLKKVLALVVALTMVLGTVAFASFTDVAEDSDSYTAVQTLSSLEILNGYEDGTFKPEGDITRAEFCAVVCRALGLEGSANGAKGATQFTDVAADHWASGYINLAAGAKIVNGMGDGTFAPESNVTFEQAVKMLVVALGFEPMAAQKGGYPTGYLVVANTYGMTDGVKASDQTASASRGIVAQLTYNALDIPVMKQVGFGTNVEYMIMDGNNDYKYESLLTNLGVAKLEGFVSKTAIIGDMEPGMVEYTYTDANDDDYWTNKSTTKSPALYIAEGVDVDPYVCVSSIAYVRELSRNKHELIAIMANEDSEVIEFNATDIDWDETTDDAIYYYPTADSNKSERIRLASYKAVSDGNVALKVYKNYADLTGKAFTTVVPKDTKEDMIITVIENSGDSKFDAVLVKKYETALVEEVEAEKDRFTTKSSLFSFDFEDEEVTNKIVNAEGEAITLADFAENDVVAVLCQLDSNGKAITRDFDWIEVINLGQNSVEGVVTEKGKKNNGTVEIYVDGTAYELVEGTAAPEVGDEGIFFLSATGKIFDSDTTTASGNYGYILETAQNDSGFSKVWQVKLLTMDNTIVVYDVADSFKVNGTPYKSADLAKDTNTVKVDILDALALSDDHNALADQRIVTYKLNSSNYIKEIKSVTSKAITALDADKNEIGLEYKADAQRIGGKTLEDNAVVFNVSADAMTSAYVTDITALVDENNYAGYVCTNAKDENDCFVITFGGSKIDPLADVAVVTGVTKITTEDDEDAIKVRYYISNEEDIKELIIVDDSTISEEQNDKDNKFGVEEGSLIMFAADAEGLASAYTVLANFDGSKFVVNSDAIAAIKTAGAKDEVDFLYNEYIYDYESKSKGVLVTYEVDKNGDSIESIMIESDTNRYTLDNTKSNLKVNVYDWQGGDVSKADYEVNSGSTKVYTNANLFFAKTVDGAAADFISIGEKVKIK